MSLYLYGSILAAAAAGESAISTGIIDAGTALGNLSASAILGVVCLCCIYAIIKLYRDKENSEEALKTMIASTTSAISKNSEMLDKISDKIDKCGQK